VCGFHGVARQSTPTAKARCTQERNRVLTSAKAALEVALDEQRLHPDTMPELRRHWVGRVPECKLAYFTLLLDQRLRGVLSDRAWRRILNDLSR
jgi:hypothetical protein